VPTPRPQPTKLEGVPAAHRTTHVEEARRLEAALDRGPHRVVHEGVFNAVQKHFLPACSAMRSFPSGR
jgi:hypothetical protein